MDHNLGHERVLTTICSYGQVASAVHGEIIGDIANPKQSERADAAEVAKV